MILLIIYFLFFHLCVNKSFFRVDLLFVNSILIHSLCIFYLLKDTFLTLLPIFIGHFEPFLPLFRLQIDQLDTSFGLFDGMEIDSDWVITVFDIISQDLHTFTENFRSLFIPACPPEEKAILPIDTVVGKDLRYERLLEYLKRLIEHGFGLLIFALLAQLLSDPCSDPGPEQQHVITVVVEFGSFHFQLGVRLMMVLFSLNQVENSEVVRRGCYVRPKYLQRWTNSVLQFQLLQFVLC